MWGVGEGCDVSANEYSCALRAQINFEDLTPYLTGGGQLNEGEVADKNYLNYHTRERQSKERRGGLLCFFQGMEMMNQGYMYAVRHQAPASSR
jgi:hypothetical protein